MSIRKRVAILISGRGSNMAALIDAAEEADFPADIALVISNRTDAAGLTEASSRSVRTLTIESKPFGKDRAAFEAALQAALDEASIDLICLAGFMRLFTAEFAARWHGRMLNVHPSLLPSFPGLDPIGQALRSGVTIAGATVHFVTAETDAGPIVMQGSVPVHGGDTVESLAARVLDVEHRIYPQALRLVASDAIKIDSVPCRIDPPARHASRLTAP